MGIVIADVGGTNVRFAVSSNEDPTLRHIAYLRCADFERFEDAFASFLASLPCSEQNDCYSLSLAVAGPVNNELVQLSNNKWRFGKEQLVERLRLDRLLVINDFTAQALAQQSALDTDRVKLLDGIVDAEAPLLVIGPGTGLGVSALIPLAQGALPIEGEGGNVRFVAQTTKEHDLLEYMRRHTDHVVVEHFVCGPGLENIYAFLVEGNGGEPGLSAESIGTAALQDEGICREAVHLMSGILGSVMADHVLTMGCWGGAVIAGGVMPRLAPLIADSPFERRFRSAGEMTSLLANVPVWLSTDPDAGLKGALAALGNPHLAHRMLRR